jgi:L-lactate permease
MPRVAVLSVPELGLAVLRLVVLGLVVLGLVVLEAVVRLDVESELGALDIIVERLAVARTGVFGSRFGRR